MMIATMKAIQSASYGQFCGEKSEATFRQVDRAVEQIGPDPRMGDTHL